MHMKRYKDLVRGVSPFLLCQDVTVIGILLLHDTLIHTSFHRHVAKKKDLCKYHLKPSIVKSETNKSSQVNEMND